MARTFKNSHSIAWDGISFLVPESWSFASYSYKKKGVTSIQLEDDYNIRLEVEWTRPHAKLNLDRIRKRYAKKAQGVEKHATKSFEYRGLPSGWGAHLYTMPDGFELLSAYYLSPQSEVCVWFRGHFSDKDPEDPEEVLKLMTGCEVRTKGMVPWSVYDIQFEVPSKFRLLRTAFHAGRKELTFQWRLRKYRLWFFSLAEIILRDHDMLEWVVDFLNKSKDIKGPKFVIENGSICAKRRWRYPIGHNEEIGRLCFQYKIDCVHLEEENQIALSIFQYRTKSDLKQLE
ncbi:MAG: hypothetical protein QGF67_06270 [Lentisphaeria bacterium]|nr:hypothetical protein [Lentisphaeria bacterium]